MDAPTKEEVRARSQILAAAYPSPAGDAALDVLILDADALVSAITGRDIGVSSGEEVPLDLVPIAKRAVAHKAEELDGQTAAQRAEVLASAEGGLASFTAGPYSESYFQPGSSRTERTILAKDPVLAEELWLLLTDAKRAELLYLLDPSSYPLPGAAAVQEVDWFPEGVDRWTGGWFGHEEFGC